MWLRLPSSQINKIAWDVCINNDPTGLVYATSWYLDAVAPGWEGWVKEEENGYVAVWPVVKRKIAGFSVIAQPLLTQQFGLFLKKQNNEAVIWPELASLLLNSGEAIEKHSIRSADYKQLVNILPLKIKVNQVLSLNRDYLLIQAAFSLNRHRDLKKAAAAKLLLQTGEEVWPAIYELYLASVLPRLNKKQQTRLIKIIPLLVKAAVAHNSAQFFLILLPSGEPVAGAFFLQFKNRLTYLLPAASAIGKKVGASTFLLDQVCRKYAGSNFLLDFEGSSLPGLSQFYASLGAEPEHYGLLENYNFSLPLKILYTFKNWFKPLRTSKLKPQP